MYCIRDCSSFGYFSQWAFSLHAWQYIGNLYCLCFLILFVSILPLCPINVLYLIFWYIYFTIMHACICSDCSILANVIVLVLQAPSGTYYSHFQSIDPAVWAVFALPECLFHRLPPVVCGGVDGGSPSAWARWMVSLSVGPGARPRRSPATYIR